MGWTGACRKFGYFVNEVTVVTNPQVNKTLKLLNKDSKIVDLGSGGRKITKETITVDFVMTDNTDIVSDIHFLPLKDDTVDAVFCTGVLEHIGSPEKVLNEINRILKKGGIVHLEVPFLQGYHPDPKDFWRWTLDGLLFLAKSHSFREVNSGFHIGPSCTVLWIMDAYITILFGPKHFGKFLSRIFCLLFFHVKYLDYFLVNRKEAASIASGIYFVGKKV